MDRFEDQITAVRLEGRSGDASQAGRIGAVEIHFHMCGRCSHTLTMAEIIERHCITCAEIQRRRRG